MTPPSYPPIWIPDDPVKPRVDDNVALPLPAPDPGDCLDGTTEWGFLPCEVVAEVEAIRPTPTPSQTLPVTGGFEMILVVAAAGCLAAGTALRTLARH